MTVTYWSDYACPFCYIGETRLVKAIKTLGLEDQIQLEMKAFQLDPAAPLKSTGSTLDRAAEKYGMSKEQTARQIESISKMGIAEGLDFRYATTPFTNTMDAHRLTKYANARDRRIGRKLEEELYHAYFGENRELADHSVLIEKAVSAGLSKEETEALLTSDAYRADVLADEQEALRNGVQAVPFFVIGSYGIPGAFSTEHMVKALSAVISENDVKDSAEAGQSCGTEGCRLR